MEVEAIAASFHVGLRYGTEVAPIRGDGTQVVCSSPRDCLWREEDPKRANVMTSLRFRRTERDEPHRGFSLIELLIVVAIILVIAAIAIPNFMRSRIAANESASVQNMRNITTANVVYSSTYGVGYATSLAALGPPSGSGVPSSANAQLID